MKKDYKILTYSLKIMIAFSYQYKLKPPSRTLVVTVFLFPGTSFYFLCKQWNSAMTSPWLHSETHCWPSTKVSSFWRVHRVAFVRCSIRVCSTVLVGKSNTHWPRYSTRLWTWLSVCGRGQPFVLQLRDAQSNKGPVYAFAITVDHKLILLYFI